MTTQIGLQPQFNTYDQQKCFIGYTHKASWSEDILAACTEVLPRFGLEAWYADDQFEPGRSLKEKVVEMIANARYGIFDLSAMYDNERKEWVLPRNVLIELGIAIALNRPVLLLRTAENRIRGCPLPACLSGIDDIIEFSGETTLKRELEKHIPQWLNVSPERMWWARACLFGGRDCEYREVHPRMERWRQEGLHCHVADGPDADRVDFRGLVEDEIRRYNDLTFDYLDACKPTHPYHFVQCAHCQVVRSSQFAIYRITPQTDADTYIAVGMSIALETQFGYEIPKIFFTADVRDVPSLLSGYEVVEAVNTKGRRQRLRKALPVVVQRVEECVWNPRVLPFEKPSPIVDNVPMWGGRGVAEEEPKVAISQHNNIVIDIRMMRLYVETPSGDRFEANIPYGAKISWVAVDFFESQGWPLTDSRGRGTRAVVELVDAGHPDNTKRLNPDSRISEAGLRNDDTLRIYPESRASGGFSVSEYLQDMAHSQYGHLVYRRIEPSTKRNDVVADTGTMRLYVETPSGDRFEADIPYEAKISQVAGDFFESQDWPLTDSRGRRMRAVVELVDPRNPDNTKRLNSDRSISEAGLRDGDTLRIYPESRAGGFDR